MIYLSIKKLLKRLIWGHPPKLVYGIKFGIGEKLLMCIDPYSSSQRIFGFYEKEIAAYFAEFARKCDYFFDIGAADGYYSLIYRKYNKHGKIFVCECTPEFYELQKRNFKLNNMALDNIIFQTNKFIWDEIANNTIKIDVDGGEPNVLKSGINQLKNNQCYLIIETHSLKLEKDCINFLKGLQYESKIIKNCFWRIILPEFRQIKHNRWFIAKREVIHYAGGV